MAQPVRRHYDMARGGKGCCETKPLKKACGGHVKKPTKKACGGKAMKKGGKC